MSHEHKHISCLVLNADFTPLSIISWQKALTWQMKYDNNSKYGIEVIDFYKDDFIAGVNNKKYPIPAVCRTKKFFKHSNNSIVFSRKNIYIRDNYTCQYCLQEFDHKQLTYDHVIPKSKWDKNKQGSPTNWTNIVTACVQCNRKKGDRTPKQANMPLLRNPEKPNKNVKYLTISMRLAKIKDRIPEEWKLYLPESYLQCLPTPINV
jgi:hypothetical protein